MTRVFFHDSFREISTNIMALSTLRTRMRIVGRVFKHGTQSSLEMIKLLLCAQQMSTNYTIIRERCCYGYFEPPTSATKQSIVTGQAGLSLLHEQFMYKEYIKGFFFPSSSCLCLPVILGDSFSDFCRSVLHCPR